MTENLLFDLGGVIMDIDRNRCVEAFRRLGWADVDMYLGEYGQIGAFGDLEKGLITPARFFDAVRAHIPGCVTDGMITDAFNAFLIGIPVERLAALRGLRSTHRVYLISNTNQVMWDTKIAEQFRQEGLTVNDYFDGIITSFEARAYKPSPEIFNMAIDKFRIDPAHTTFFDDSLANCEAAARLGFRYRHVIPGHPWEIS